MAAVASPTWPQAHPFAHMRPHFQYARPQPPITTPDIQIPERNQTELSRELLITVLNHFATLVPAHFNGRPLRLIVHGGACMLLHPGLSSLAIQQQYLASHSPSGSLHNKLPRRVSTRDVDYIHRSFVTEWQDQGVMDATERIRSCIKLTAQHFRLGADWMNSDADVALPMTFDANGKQYDPVYVGAIQPNNVHLHTVFESTNGMLTLISVPPVWSIALKLARYTKYDPGDICLLLRNGTHLNNVQWTPETLETWLRTDAAPMSYQLWTEAKQQELQAHIQDAIRTVNRWDPDTARGPVIPAPVDDDAEGWAHGGMVGPAVPEPLGTRPAQDPRWSLSLPPAHGLNSHHLTPAPDPAVGVASRWATPQPHPQPHPSLRHTHSNSSRTSWPPPDPRLAAGVDQLDRDIASMLQHSLNVSHGTLPPLTDTTNAKMARRSRDKQRARSRARSRSSKWGAWVRYFEESDGESDGDDRREERAGFGEAGRGRPVMPHAREGEAAGAVQPQQQQQHGQQFLPRPSAWLIYGPPAGGMPSQEQQSLVPYHAAQSRPPTTIPYGYEQGSRPSSAAHPYPYPYPAEQRRGSTPYIPDQRYRTISTPYIPTDHNRRSSRSTPYPPPEKHHPRSATSTPYIPIPSATPYNPEHYNHQRSATPMAYIPEPERPVTPFIPPTPTDPFLATMPFRPDYRARSRSRPPTPYHAGQRSRSVSPMPQPQSKERHRPPPLELSPLGPLLVF